MEATFLPPRKKALAGNIAIMVALVLLGLGLVVLANMPAFIHLANILVAVAFLLAIPFFYFFYQHNKAKQIRYVLDEERLQLHWGANSLSLPLRLIEWAYPLTEFEDEMPLPQWHIPGAYLNLFDIKGMGKTRFVATDPQSMILMKAEERYVVISPQDAAGFLSQLAERKSLASISDAKVEEENFTSLIKSVWQDRKLRAWLIFGFLALLILWIVAGLMLGFRQRVTWVTLEQVRASQLLLLPIIGSFAWMISHVLSFFIFINEHAERHMVYLVLAGSTISCLVLAAAAFMMAI
jgi:hypothetical protein